MGRVNWAALTHQIKSRRSGAAQFFKPVCVIAAIDLANEDQIDPHNVDAQAISDRFSDYVTPFYPDRGKDGFKPLWHLTNDCIWTFSNKGRILGAQDFPHGAPATKAKLFSSFDRLEINAEYIDLWKQRNERKTLRDYMLIILNESDTNSRQMIPSLFDVKNLTRKDLWPSADTLKSYFRDLKDQLSLFEDETLETWNERNEAKNSNLNLSAVPVSGPEAVEHVPTPIAYTWLKGRIVVGPNSANVPVFPYKTSEHNHILRLEACLIQAQELIHDLSKRNWQVRNDYKAEFDRYLKRLPTHNEAGNILLADAAARTIRQMFSAEQGILPPSFAARLKTFLEQHIALRPYYPEIDEFYRSVKTGHIDVPLPLDAVSDVINVIHTQTPSLFDESVSVAIDETSSPGSQANDVEHSAAAPDSILPPADPLGELDPSKARDFQTAGWINNLWKVFIAGPSIYAAVEGWSKTYKSLSGPVTLIVNWLRQFLEIK